ncbi:hypothetical protein [Micromonospora inaquosa]|uniref:Uncharacterized protein n=1 Tax=Micromonospora inaquosa TaxID=2203716 RepID=A0A3N9WT11_9ACTN|nr:hypothetical protein [Micromonospora inaquosa]RQW98152.1 hypothetical protein DLJ59_27735 [Micromonospora inaquosa]
MTAEGEPPETHPVHTVSVDMGHGPTFEVQAVPFNDPSGDTPHANLWFRVTGGDYDMAVSCRSLISDEDMSALIDALTSAREDARKQAALFGWTSVPEQSAE